MQLLACAHCNGWWFRAYLVLLRLCLLPVRFSLDPSAPSPITEEDRCRLGACEASLSRCSFPSFSGRGEERGGGKVASLIVADVHNILVQRILFGIGE